jgi:hypothetical protein
VLLCSGWRCGRSAKAAAPFFSFSAPPPPPPPPAFRLNAPSPPRARPRHAQGRARPGKASQPPGRRPPGHRARRVALSVLPSPGPVQQPRRFEARSRRDPAALLPRRFLRGKARSQLEQQQPAARGGGR